MKTEFIVPQLEYPATAQLCQPAYEAIEQHYAKTTSEERLIAGSNQCVLPINDDQVDELNKKIIDAFAVFLGQCTTRLKDKMHNDPKWDAVNKDCKALELYALIKREIMKQMGF